MVPNPTVMTVAAIFKSRLLKNGRCKKNSHIFVSKLKLQVTLSIQSLHRYTLLMVKKKNLNLFEKNRGTRLKLSSATLRVCIRSFDCNFLALYQQTVAFLHNKIKYIIDLWITFWGSHRPHYCYTFYFQKCWDSLVAVKQLLNQCYVLGLFLD